MRVAPAQMDKAREAQIRAVGWPYVMDHIRACDARTDFLAALPALRELTINSSFTPSIAYSNYWRHIMKRLVIGRLYDKMKERPELGLPPVRVHVCGLAVDDLQDAFEWSQWYKPSDCMACTDHYREVSRAQIYPNS